MAAEPKKKISKVRSKTRRAHRHDSIKNPALWQTGMLSKKDRMEEFAKYRRRKDLASAPAKKEVSKADKPAKITTTTPTAKKQSGGQEKVTPPKKKD